MILYFIGLTFALLTAGHFARECNEADDGGRGGGGGGGGGGYGGRSRNFGRGGRGKLYFKMASLFTITIPNLVTT